MNIIIGRNWLGEGRKPVAKQTGEFQCAVIGSDVITYAQTDKCKTRTSVCDRSGSIVLQIRSYINIIS
jgi:hypothetical protein